MDATYGSIAAPATQRRRPLRWNAAAAALCLGLVALHAATTRPDAALFAIASPERVCVVQVAAGDEYVAVSDLTLPGKTAWAEAHGYSVLNYVFDSTDELPQCCADRDSFACTLTNVQIKYCATYDALTTGGAGANGGSNGRCDYVMVTDADAVFSPDGPPLDEFLAPAGGRGPPAVVISAADPAASAATGWRAPRTTLDTLTTFNSGVMLWRDSAEARAVVEAVLNFDDATFDMGSGSCSHDVFGYGDQWSLCGAAALDPSLLESFAAFTHPKKLQRAVLWLPSSKAPVSGEDLDIAAADWPEEDGDEAFVVNCAGADAETCASYFLDRPGLL